MLKRGLATAVSNPLIVKNNLIQASVILTRAPQLTRDATAFEKAYFDYSEKLERQTSIATPTDFYFKKGSVAERRWKHEESARQDAMKKTISLTQAVQDSQATWEKENEGLAASTKFEKLSSTTSADKAQDLKALDRALKQSLYLVVKSSAQSPWQFPQGPLDSTEYLHEAAERTLSEKCGADMDTWFVGRQPIAFHKETVEQPSSKIFFMKARVYAGQVKPSKDVADFAWLTKNELEQHLSPQYYKSIKGCLSDI